jgi:hypothetical protein
MFNLSRFSRLEGAGMADPSIKFPCKRNTNGTLDLTCPFCHRIFALGVHDSEIEEIQRSHGCWEQDRRFFDPAVVRKPG